MSDPRCSKCTYDIPCDAHSDAERYPASPPKSLRELATAAMAKNNGYDWGQFIKRVANPALILGLLDEIDALRTGADISDTQLTKMDRLEGALRTIAVLVDDDFRLAREGKPQLSRQYMLNMLKSEATSALSGGDKLWGDK